MKKIQFKINYMDIFQIGDSNFLPFIHFSPSSRKNNKYSWIFLKKNLIFMIIDQKEDIVINYISF